MALHDTSRPWALLEMRFCSLFLVLLLVSACSSKGGYYKDDGPPRGVSGSDIERIPDAIPKQEPRSQTGNNPYEALGKTYYPMKSASGYRAQGGASWYGKKFHGRRTSSGEPYDMFAMTAAHPVLPLPTYVRVRSLENGRSVVVKVNDRGPFLSNRIIDLSYAAAYKLGIVATGTGLVEVTAVFSAGAAQSRPATVTVPVSSRNVAGVNLFIQFGAFSVKRNAEDLQRRLNVHGFESTVEVAVDDSRRLYRVRSGPYHQVSEADRVTASAKQYGYDTKLVIE